MKPYMNHECTQDGCMLCSPWLQCCFHGYNDKEDKHFPWHVMGEM